MMLPGIMMRQPMLVAQITPFIFGSDFVNAKILAYLTTRIEEYKKDSMEIQSIRTKVESFDMKNADLLQRSGTGSNGIYPTKVGGTCSKHPTKDFHGSLSDENEEILQLDPTSFTSFQL
jgi:ribosomal protein S18